MPGRCRHLGLESVRIDDPFWNKRQEVNRAVTVDHIYEQLVNDGRLENLRNVDSDQPEEGVTPGSRRFRDDSDVYKWLEAASYVLASDPVESLKTKVDDVVSLITNAQEPDGYINSYFTLYAHEDKWTNLGVMHELYCAGHLFEAAVAHHRATGREDLLTVATKFADHLTDVFGEEGREGAPGHPEVELGLVRLYRVTEERSYLDLASFFLNQRGKAESVFKTELQKLGDIAGNESIYDTYRTLFTDDNGEYSGEYVLDHRPVREQTAVTGHAVMAMYLYTGMTDVAVESDKPELSVALERLWHNMTQKRMYVTGGVGNHHRNEGFTEDYDLPKKTAYSETCAAVGSVFWNHRMLELITHGKYGDLLERTLYNAFLAGISPDGSHFAYVNPLESNGREHPLQDLNPARFTLDRQPWYETPCCPPNAARLLASLEKYIYMLRGAELFVNLYVGSELTTEIDDTRVRVEQRTEYPWDGLVEFEIEPERPVSIALRPRIPGWCPDTTLRVNGDPVQLCIDDGFATVDRTWESGDLVSIEFSMPVTQVSPDPSVSDSAGMVALRRGPVVYCVEGEDHDHRLSLITVPPNAEFNPVWKSGVSRDFPLLEGTVPLDDTTQWDMLYQRRDSNSAQDLGTLVAVPYFAWRNRGQSEMRVWLRSG